MEDGEAGDNVYGASIPGSNNLTVIRFYIRAVDDEGLDASLPMEGASRAIFDCCGIPRGERSGYRFSEL